MATKVFHTTGTVNGKTVKMRHSLVNVSEDITLDEAKAQIQQANPEFTNLQITDATGKDAGPHTNREFKEHAPAAPGR